MKYLRQPLLRTIRSAPLSRVGAAGSRSLSSRASAILSSLDIPTSGEVSGVYGGSGQWGGNGDIMESICPTTGEVIARVKSVRVELSTCLMKDLYLLYACQSIGGREGS